MRITFVLNKGIDDCIVKITDSLGTKSYTLFANKNDENTIITVDVLEASFGVNLIPSTSSLDDVLSGIETASFKDKIFKKVTKSLVSAIDKCILQVGCSYLIDNAQDGDVFNINMQLYICDIYDSFDVLGLAPVMYSFYEISRAGSRFKALSAFSVNRKKFLKAEKKLALISFWEWGILGIVAYPLQILRIKHLSKDKKVSKTIVKFHNMTEEQREKYLKKIDTI